MKSYKHFYITNDLDKKIAQIEKETGLKHTQIMERAANVFIENGERIAECTLIKQRTHPNYIKRDVMYDVWVEDIIIEYAKRIAKRYGARGFSAVLYEMLKQYAEAFELQREDSKRF